MKTLVIFGSKSDKKVYNPFINSLKEIVEVQFEILSAHRNPSELDQLLKTTPCDAIVAGAGLAAHLPGVVASKTTLPVFGIPVNAHLGGIDALLSIQQMPYGVPVLSTGVEKTDHIISFINSLKNTTNLTKKINLVINPNILNLDFVIRELDRTQELGNELNFKIQTSSEIVENKFNIQMINNSSDLKTDAFSICVPVLDKTSLSDIKSIKTLHEWTSISNLWVGTNNTRNALLFYKKLLNIKKN